MKLIVINGNMRHGSTWHCTQKVIDELRKTRAVEVTEFFLPKELPHFCNGCFSCIYNGESTCPHRAFTQPITDALLASDLIILTSPVYGMDVSSQMKALIDHLCFMWMSHRPDPAMFSKSGLTVTTSAGAGLGHTTRTMKSSLRFWGVKRIYSFKFPVSAMKWSDVSAKNQIKIERQAVKIAAKIARSARTINKSAGPLFRHLFFWMMTGMQRKNNWNLTDRNHWEKLGWLAGSKPF